MSAAETIPRDLRYTSNHGWVRLVDGEHAVIGITCHAQDCLRGILSIELPYVGKHVNQNEAVATVETAKTAVEILSPLSGEILSVNTELRNSPLLLGRDPYGEGWIAKLRIQNMKEVKGLMDSMEYSRYVHRLSFPAFSANRHY